MPAQPLADKRSLLNKEALQSLRDELKVKSLLDRPHWHSVHSHHYLDTAENVWRELDALSLRQWTGALGDQPVRVKLYILVESKSLRGKQILLPRFNPVKQAVLTDWLGQHGRRDERLEEFARVGIPLDLASQLDFGLFSAGAEIFPDSPSMLFPPRLNIWNSAGFVEAQNAGGAVAELRASVVWKARLGLQSAARALVAPEVAQNRRELLMALQFARIAEISTQQADFDLHAEIRKYVQKVRFSMLVFHPILVVDADMWGLLGDDVQLLDHVRLHQTGVSRYPYFWLDIVHRDAADRVIREAQVRYEAQAVEKGLEPDEPQLGTADYDIARP